MVSEKKIFKKQLISLLELYVSMTTRVPVQSEPKPRSTDFTDKLLCK